MIGTIDIRLQASKPDLPLQPLMAFKNSPSSIRLRDVPRQVGNWHITKVYFQASYPDNAIQSATCVKTGGIWIGTISGSTVSGKSTNGFAVYADGIDENGNAVTGYVLGKGDIYIYNIDNSIDPDTIAYYVHYLSAMPEDPKIGDCIYNDKTIKIYNGTSWVYTVVPLSVSQLSNDSGYITSADVDNTKLWNTGRTSYLDGDLDYYYNIGEKWTLTSKIDPGGPIDLNPTGVKDQWKSDDDKYWLQWMYNKILEKYYWHFSWEGGTGLSNDTLLNYPDEDVNSISVNQYTEGWVFVMDRETVQKSKVILSSELSTIVVSQLSNDSGYLTKTSADNDYVPLTTTGTINQYVNDDGTYAIHLPDDADFDVKTDKLHFIVNDKRIEIETDDDYGSGQIQYSAYAGRSNLAFNSINAVFDDNAILNVKSTALVLTDKDNKTLDDLIGDVETILAEING